MVLYGLGIVGMTQAQAYLVGIGTGTKALYLQVGVGNISAPYINGGTPGNNTTINSVSGTVPVASLGSGTPITLTTDSPVTNSAYDNFAFCDSPATTGEVYVGGFYRTPGTGGAATLTVSTPANLVNANGDTLSFGTIAWTSTGNGDTTQTIPSGNFLASGGAQTLRSITRNNFFESCLAFRYLNTQLVPAGTFTGRATYTLTAP